MDSFIYPTPDHDPIQTPKFLTITPKAAEHRDTITRRCQNKEQSPRLSIGTALPWIHSKLWKTLGYIVKRGRVFPQSLCFNTRVNEASKKHFVMRVVARIYAKSHVNRYGDCSTNFCKCFAACSICPAGHFLFSAGPCFLKSYAQS